MRVVEQILAVLLAALTLPLVLELALTSFGNLVLLLGRKAVGPPVPPFAGLFYVVIPAHNEHLLIKRTVLSLLASADADTRILVIAHNCTDDTASIVRTTGAEVLELNEDSGRGKGAALQAGFAYAAGQGATAIGVMDADSTASPSLVAALRAALATSPAAQCKYELESGPEYSAAANLQALAFRAINTVRARGRSALGISCGIFGNGFAIRASVLQAVPYSAFSIAEDLEYHIALVRNGYRVVYTGEAEMTGAGASGRAAVAQRSRWEGGRLRVARESIFPLLGQVIRGRVRLFEPTLDLLSLPMAFAVFLLLMCFLVPVLPLKLYAVAALCLLAFHVLIAITASPSPRSALNLLVRVPFYIVWKVALVPRILAKSRRNTTWDRSVRSASPVQPAAQVQDNRIS